MEIIDFIDNGCDNFDDVSGTSTHAHRSSLITNYSPKSNRSDVVSAGRHQSPELAPLRRSNWLIFNALHEDFSIVDRVSVDVLHQPFDSHVAHLHVFNQRLLVLAPFGRKFTLRRVFAARQLQGDLKAVGEDVVEVLHAS